MTTLTYPKKPNITYLIPIVGAILMPDVVFGLLAELAHLLIECVHLLFEIFESWLDHMVEHHFHTGTRETQLIVFYLMVAMASVGLYFLWRKAKKLSHSAKNAIQAILLEYKNWFLSYWEASAHNKFKLIAGANVALTLIYLVGF
jgi:hypothetical protein